MYDMDTVNRIENSSNPNNIITTTHNQTSSPYKKELKPKITMNKQKKNETVLPSSQPNSSKKNKKPFNKDRQVYMKPLTKAKRYKPTYDDNKKQTDSSYMYTDNHLE